MIDLADVSVAETLRFFSNRNTEVGFLVPTDTGLRKSILDATSGLRSVFERSSFHMYAAQGQGSSAKVVRKARIVLGDRVVDSKVSLYRPPTKKGDPRIWISKLPGLVKPGNLLAIIPNGDELIVVNASSPGLIPGLSTAPPAPMADLLSELLLSIRHGEDPAAIELLEMLRRRSGEWYPAGQLGKIDTEVGRVLEDLVGLRRNSSKLPDYKGIELKAAREGKNRRNLFAQVPDWASSVFKSSAEILDVFGYQRREKYASQLRCTVSAVKRNSQGLKLSVSSDEGMLEEISDRLGFERVVCWKMDTLKDRLAEKHRQTFWVSAESRIHENREEFRYVSILHTKQPRTEKLPVLLAGGNVTVDHLITRDQLGRCVEKGPLFKIKPRDLNLLFPPAVRHTLHQPIS